MKFDRNDNEDEDINVNYYATVNQTQSSLVGLDRTGIRVSNRKFRSINRCTSRIVIGQYSVKLVQSLTATHDMFLYSL